MIAAQPNLDWDSHKILIRDIIRQGVPVTTIIDGETVNVTDGPGPKPRRGWKGLLGRR